MGRPYFALHGNRKSHPGNRMRTARRSGRSRRQEKEKASPNKRAAQKMPPVRGKRPRSVKSNVRRDHHGIRLSAPERRAQSGISFDTKGDPNGRVQRRIRETLRDSFTQDEIRSLGKVRVEFGQVKYGNRAVYYRKYDTDPVTTIRFDPKQAEEDDFVHEFLHALKATDSTRTGFAATQFKRIGSSDRFDRTYADAHRSDLTNIEEATVVAESAIRTKRPARTPSGYYKDIPAVGDDTIRIRKAYDEDRLTLLDAPKGTKVKDTKGLQGKAAANKLNRNFVKTNISKKEEGGVKAITSYHRLKDSKKH